MTVEKQKILVKLDKLIEESSEIFKSINDLDKEDLSNSAYGWSIVQIFSHLNTAEIGSMLYMKKKMQAGSSMPDYSVSNKVRYFLTKGLLQSSLRWKAPKVVANPKADYTFEEVKSEWAKNRELIREYINEYPEELLSRAVYKHPFAGRLDLDGAIDSFIYHQRHHKHQIRRIRKKIGK